MASQQTPQRPVLPPESSRLISPADEVGLCRDGLLDNGEGISNQACQRIHKRRLNRFSDEEYQDLALSPVSLVVSSASSADSFATIPKYLISQETLLHIGLSEAKASELWHLWENWDTRLVGRTGVESDDYDFQINLIEFVISRAIKGQEDYFGEDDAKWIACFDKYGLDTTTTEAIMHPFFRDLRLTQSSAYWAKDTMEMRYAGLEEVQKTSREREAQQDNALRPSNVTGNLNPSVPAVEAQAITGPGLAASFFSAQHAPGHISLYRGTTQARISELLTTAGEWNYFRGFLSHFPTDFTPRRAIIYFTTQFKLAQRYAAYAKQRSTGIETCVIFRLQIASAVIESLQPPEIQIIHEPNAEWRELVWHSRNQVCLPRHLKKYQQATLIIGPIAKKPNWVYGTVRACQDLDDSYVSRVETVGISRPAFQYVFQDDEGEEFLEAHGKNMKMTACSNADLQRLIAQAEDE